MIDLVEIESLLVNRGRFCPGKYCDFVYDPNSKRYIAYWSPMNSQDLINVTNWCTENFGPNYTPKSWDLEHGFLTIKTADDLAFFMLRWA